MRRLFVVVVALAAACSQESSNDPISPGCQLAGGQCVMGASVTDTSCGARYGTWLPAGCPAEDRVGLCASTTEVTAYYEPYYSAGYAQWVCTVTTGTWIPEPAPITPPTGGGGTVASTVSCTFSSIGLCYEVNAAPGSAAIASTEAICMQITGGYSDAGCSGSGAVAGHCDLTDPDYPGAMFRAFYLTSSFTETTAQESCADDGGTWVN